MRYLKKRPSKCSDGWSVAQLGARVVRNDEVVGSIPIGSTTQPNECAEDNDPCDLLPTGLVLSSLVDLDGDLSDIKSVPEGWEMQPHGGTRSHKSKKRALISP